MTSCPEAFDITKKPWININNAPTSKVWQAVEKCPSKALTITYNHDVKIIFDEGENHSTAILNENRIGLCEYDVTPEGRKIPVIPTCSYARKVLTS